MTELATLILSLLTMHFLADFYLQPLNWVKDRNARHYRSSKLICHVLLHTLLSALVLLMWEYSFNWHEWHTALLGAAVIGISHWVIDVAKSYSKQNVLPFLLDQLAHWLIIFAVCLSVSDKFSVLTWLAAQLGNYQIWVIILAYCMVLTPCSVLIRLLLERWKLDNVPLSLPNAGHVIGLLERTLMLTFILLNELGAVGFILAAKSVFRFGDLTNNNEKRLTEYVMLGTLVSVMLTFAIGLSARALLF